MDITRGFVVIGDDTDERIIELGEGAVPAGNVIVFDETLYIEVREPWNKGDQVGSGHGVCVVTPGGQAVCSITFSFGAEDHISASGTLPFGKSIGSGVLTVVGGTGQYKNAGGQVTVEVRNPKRYGFQA